MVSSSAVPLAFNPSALSLADLENYDATAKAGGAERRFLCPFPACANHQEAAIHRTLTVNAQTGAWNCKRCHEKGLLGEWHTRTVERQARPFLTSRERDRARLRSLLGVPTPTPVAPAAVDPELARALAPLLAGVVSLEGSPGVGYLAGRGLPVDFCKTAGVRFAPDYFGRPAVVFGLRDGAGKIAALHGRYIDGKGTPKSRTKGPMKAAIFATPGAWEGDPWQGRVVITEAPIDALSLAFCGVPALALCGTSGGKELLKERLALRQVIAAFDNDAAANENAGQKAGRGLALLLHPVGGQVLRMLPPDGAKDWNEALSRVGREALRDYLLSELSEGVTAAPPSPVSFATNERVPVVVVAEPDNPELLPLHDAALLAFVQSAYRGTGADIRLVNDRVSWVEKGFVTGIWNGPSNGALVLGPDYWAAVPPFLAPSLQPFGAASDFYPSDVPADLVDLVPLAAEVEAAADAIRHEAMIALLAAAEANALPLVPVSLGPGRVTENPNETVRALRANARIAAQNALPTESNPRPHSCWHSRACAALDDLETLAFWWRGLNA